MPPKKKQARPVEGSHRMKTRRRGPASPLPPTPAPPPARRGRTSSQDPQPAAALQPSSRSQTPHFDTESDSLAQVPESRSTTPPVRRATRSQTRSISPDAAADQINKKIAHKRLAPRIPLISRPNTPSENPFADYTKKSNKRGRTDLVESNAVDIAATTNATDEERSVKRTRLDQEDDSRGDSIPEFLAPLGTIAEDSSADDVVEEVQRPPRPSLNHSRSSSHQPRITNVDAEDASAEESSDNRQLQVIPSPMKKPDTPLPREESTAESSLEKRYLFSGKRLTPKPKPSAQKSKARDPMTDDMEERNRLHFEIFGRDMPIPRYQKGHPKYAHSHHRDEDNSGVEDEDEMSFIMDDPSPGRGKPPSQNLALPLTGPGSLRWMIQKDKEDKIVKKAQKKAQEERDARASRETHFTHFNLVFPADSDHPEFLLTDRRLLEMFCAARDHMERRPDASIPDGPAMQQILDEYDGWKTGRPGSSSSSESMLEPTITYPGGFERQKLLTYEPLPEPRQTIQSGADAEYPKVSRAHNGGQSEIQGGPAEVRAATEPQTPATRQPDAQQSRGWLSGVSSLLKSPMKIFGRRQSVQAATTNGAAVTNTPSMEPVINQAAALPLTPAIRRRRNVPPPRSEVHLRRNFAAATDRMSNRPIASPQTDLRPRLPGKPRGILSKTTARVRFYDPSTPLHIRGTMTEEHKSALWLAKDEAAQNKKIDENRKLRQSSRSSQQARVEEEDEHEANMHISSARAGQKRKHRHATTPEIQDLPPHVRDLPALHGLSHEEFNWEGTFTAPGSDEEDDSLDDITITGSAFNPDRESDGRSSVQNDATIQSQYGASGNLAHDDDAPWNGGFDPEEEERRRIHIEELCREPASVDYGRVKALTSGPRNMRKNTYDGDLFAQPSYVQQNINEGRYPTANPRNRIPPQIMDHVTNRMIPNPAYPEHLRQQDKERVRKMFAGNPQPPKPIAPQPEPVEAAAPISTSGGSFSAPTYQDENEENEISGGNEQRKEPQDQSIPESAAIETSVLQPLIWNKNPPPKPKPSNAQLPVSTQTPSTSDLAKQKLDKYRPARPSNLRNVTQMSPMPADQTAVQRAVQYPLGDDLSGYGFSPKMVAAVWAISEEEMIETVIPAWVLQSSGVRPLSEVEKAVAALFEEN